MSQRALAEASGLHPNTVGLIERGERDPGWNRLVKMSEALGLSMVELAQRYESIRRPAT